MSKIIRVLKVLLFVIFLLGNIQTACGLVQGTRSSRRLTNVLGEVLVETMAASVSRTLPFPIPGRPLRDTRKDFKESRRKMVSLFATQLTELLVVRQQHPRTIYKTNGINTLAPPDTSVSEKLYHLAADELAEIIKRDCRERQFLCTADMTRAIYDDDATFKDGSDIDGSYSMDAWVRGCKFLFDAKESQCKILEHTLRVTNQQVSFRFAETLTFKTILQPRVYLTGTVLMKRDPHSGLIVSYEEKWDQDMNEVLRRTQFSMYGRSVR
ncbi:hypothetical protein IV203_013214 [Nitzschia inconspicua]|uniref:Uncharacterized protein n=1 Tax=Nitzschia inconspicua TaxID=303405 RepID=A0A9K3M4R7_9STRA|nr:hypothetical protein IV203_013214 [Nitzschia inconspicua]